MPLTHHTVWNIIIVRPSIEKAFAGTNKQWDSRGVCASLRVLYGNKAVLWMTVRHLLMLKSKYWCWKWKRSRERISSEFWVPRGLLNTYEWVCLFDYGCLSETERNSWELMDCAFVFHVPYYITSSLAGGWEVRTFENAKHEVMSQPKFCVSLRFQLANSATWLILSGNIIIMKLETFWEELCERSSNELAEISCSIRFTKREANEVNNYL